MGKAGSGKSTFMKFLARHRDTQELLSRWAASNSLIVAEHYFWYPTTNNLQRNLEGLLRSLLYTVLCKAPEAIATLFPMRWARAGQRSLARWTEEELLCALRELSALQDTCFACFIVGLDEYVPSRDHGTLVRELESLAGSKNMKLCVASRPWQTFETHFGNFRHRLALHDSTISDMESYVSTKLIEAEVDTGLGTSFSDHECEADAFVKDLARKAEGVFLWAVLIVRSLRQEIEAGRSVRDLRRYVDETPLDLKTFFTTMIVERIDHRNQSAVARLLKCATLLAEAHMAAVKDADMIDHRYENLHMSFLNFSILADSDEAEQPGFASEVQTQPLYIADMKVMSEKIQRYIGRMSRDLLHIPLDRDMDDGDLNVRDMDELSQVWEVLASMRVEFLHRAVLDYLLDADVQYLLNQRVPSHFHRPDFLARITLARLKFYPKLQLCEAFPEFVPAGMQDISMVEDLHRLIDSWTPRDREDLETYLNGAPVEQNVEHCPELNTYFSAAVAFSMSSTVGERWKSDIPHICYRASSPDLSFSLLAGYEEVALTWDRYAHARRWATIDFCTLLVSFGLTHYVRQQFKRQPRDDEFAEAMMQEAVLSLIYDPTTPSHASTLASLLEHEQVRRTWVTQCDASTATAHQGWWPLVLYLWAGLVDASRLESATGDTLLENEALEVLRSHIYSIAYALCQQGYDVFQCSARHIANPQAYIGAKPSLLRDCEQQEQHLTSAELLDNIERKTCLENLLKESRLN